VFTGPSTVAVSDWMSTAMGCVGDAGEQVDDLLSESGPCDHYRLQGRSLELANGRVPRQI
jgi:hypothetical protein